MTSYRDADFRVRWNGQWAAEAQAAYALDRNMRRVPFVPHGLDRAPFSVEALMAAPDTVRYAPDYKEEVEKRLRFVEVKGCGRDETIKLKFEQIAALWAHDNELPVWFCFWNNQNRMLIEVKIDDVFSATEGAETGVFDADTAPKQYWRLEWDALGELGREHPLGR